MHDWRLSRITLDEPPLKNTLKEEDVTSKPIVPSSTSNAYEVRRLARANRASNRLAASPAIMIGEANRRPIQNQPRNEFPSFTAGMRETPRQIGAVRLKPRTVCEYLVYAVSDFADDQDKQKRWYQEKAADKESQD